MAVPLQPNYRKFVKDLSLGNVLPQLVYCTKIIACLYHKGWQFCCHLITSRNVKDLSLGFFNAIVYCTKVSVSLYHKGWHFCCHLITGRNVKDLSLGNVLHQTFYCIKISVS